MLRRRAALCCRHVQLLEPDESCWRPGEKLQQLQSVRFPGTFDSRHLCLQRGDTFRFWEFGRCEALLSGSFTLVSAHNRARCTLP